jgi:hypothetical protein
LLISSPPNKTGKTRRRPLEPARIPVDNRHVLEPAPIQIANRHAPERLLALAGHGPEGAAHAPAPEDERLPLEPVIVRIPADNRRIRERAPIPVVNRRTPEQQRALAAYGPADAPQAPAKTRRRPLEPARIPADNRHALEPTPIQIANRHAPERPRVLAAHGPAGAAHAPAPEDGSLPLELEPVIVRIPAGNRRTREPAPIPVVNRRAPEQQRALAAHGPADAAHAPAPEDVRLSLLLSLSL